MPSAYFKGMQFTGLSDDQLEALNDMFPNSDYPNVLSVDRSYDRDKGLKLELSKKLSKAKRKHITNDMSDALHYNAAQQAQQAQQAAEQAQYDDSSDDEAAEQAQYDDSSDDEVASTHSSTQQQMQQQMQMQPPQANTNATQNDTADQLNTSINRFSQAFQNSLQLDERNELKRELDNLSLRERRQMLRTYPGLMSVLGVDTIRKNVVEEAHDPNRLVVLRRELPKQQPLARRFL